MPTERPLPVAERDAYLARLGLEVEPPSVGALVRLHRAHAERVPYETMWIHLGEPWGIDPTDSVGRIVHEGRGGYCFHLNGAFHRLLRSLGYAVRRHVGGVHGPDGPAELEMTNHLVLTVGDLPDEDNTGGTWYVDVGLGDALHDPLPLRAGTYRQGPFDLTLDETPGGLGAWHLEHDPAGGFRGMAWRADDVDMVEFADRHTWLSSSPESGFVKVMTVQRRDAEGVDILRGQVLARIGSASGTTELETEADLVGVLDDVFGLRVGPVGGDRSTRLWRRVHATHLAWRERTP